MWLVYFVVIQQALQTYVALLHNLVWSCAYLSSALLCFIFGLADTLPHGAPTHYDEILLQKTFQPPIYYLSMSSTVKIIRALSALVCRGHTDSTLKFLKPFWSGSARQKSSVSTSKTSQMLGRSFLSVRAEEGEAFTSSDSPEICKIAVIFLLTVHLCMTLLWWPFIFRLMFWCLGYHNVVTAIHCPVWERPVFPLLWGVVRITMGKSCERIENILLVGFLNPSKFTV